MKLNTLLICFMGFSSAFAGNDNTNEFYVKNCGSKQQLIELANLNNSPPWPLKYIQEEWALRDIQEEREPILLLLREGNILKVADKFGYDRPILRALSAVLACRGIQMMKSAILTHGCVDLATNEIVIDNGGFNSCSWLPGSDEIDTTDTKNKP